MTLELVSIPLAFVAGSMGIMSPCVWPLVPVVMMAAAAGHGRCGPLYLAAGLATALAVSGTFLTLLLLNLGLNPDAFRYVAAVLLVLVAPVLLIRQLADWTSAQLSRAFSRFSPAPGGAAEHAAGQFGVGALLGFVWLPCVGPTLGAAIGLASLGQSVGMAFLVMLTFGIGMGSVLLFAGGVSGRLLNRWRPRLLTGAARGRMLLGALLLGLGIMVLTGLDKVLEAVAVDILPAWATAL
jgi:cytochrome c-type biogenesis protein